MYALMEGIMQIVWCQNTGDFYWKNVSKDKLCIFIHLKGQILADSPKLMFQHVIPSRLNQYLMDLAEFVLVSG